MSGTKTTSLAAFASQLRAWRQQMGWTQVEAADKLGYSASLVSGIETMDKTPTADFAQHCDTIFQTPSTFATMRDLVAREVWPSYFAPVIELEATARSAAGLTGTGRTRYSALGLKEEYRSPTSHQAATSTASTSATAPASTSHLTQVCCEPAAPATAPPAARAGPPPTARAAATPAPAPANWSMITATGSRGRYRRRGPGAISMPITGSTGDAATRPAPGGFISAPG